MGGYPKIEQDEMNVIHRGSGGAYGYDNGIGGGFSGIITLMLLVVIIVWLLFKDGKYDRHDYPNTSNPYPYPQPYAYGHTYAQNGCGICVKDESNWEEDRHISDKIDYGEERTRNEIVKQAEKTREQEMHHYEMAQQEKFQTLLAENQTLKTQNFIKTEVGTILANLGITKEAIKDGFCRESFLIEKGFDYQGYKLDKVDEHIYRFENESPKRPPYYSAGGSPEIFPYPPRKKCHPHYEE